MDAIEINTAVGSSTNLFIHLLALVERIIIRLKFDDFVKLGSDIGVSKKVA